MEHDEDASGGHNTVRFPGGSRMLVGAAAALAALAILLALTGGGRVVIAGLVVSVRDWRRPAALAVVLLLGRAWDLWRDRAHPGHLQRVSDEAAVFGLGAVPLVMIALGLRHLVMVCGGLDSHGYVSTAALLTTGRLSVPQPLVDWLPFDRAIEALAPLGYVPSTNEHEIVPRFPLGLPLVMALFRAAMGADGPFYVAPVLGAATVVLRYGIVKRVAGPLAGGLAAALVAAHPLFITYSLQPMSDVPATFWVVLAAFLLIREPSYPLLTGIAAGMATLTRPPLALAAGVLASIAYGDRRTGAVRFVIGFAPFLIILVLVHTMLYGTPATSGYGNPGDLFSVSVIPQNVRVFGKWMLYVHTPLFVLLLATAWFLHDRRLVVIAFLLFLAVAVPYMVYVPSYDDWETLRFLLPGLIFLVMVAAQTTTRLLKRYLPGPAVPLLAVAVACGVAAASYSYLQERQVFALWVAESKYPAVAEWLTRNSDEGAIVFASLHSGSIRYYAGRTTIRWDRIPAEKLGQTVAAIAARGRRMFLVLDGNAEQAEFDARFDTSNLADVHIEFIDRSHTVKLATVAPRPR